MSDEIDRASEREEFDRGVALRVRKPEHHLHPMGACHWCESIVRAGDVFCGADCRDDFERAKEARRRAGEL